MEKQYENGRCGACPQMECRAEKAIDRKIEESIRIQANRIAQATGAWSDLEDFNQELYLAVYRKQTSYKPEKSSFQTFASRIIENRKRDLIRKYRAHKNKMIRFAQTESHMA